MTAFLHKSKAMLLELMKTMPDAHIAEEEDFVVWGRQFIDIAVSRKLIRGVDATDTDLPSTPIMPCPIAWDALKRTPK
jgi:hypothetical protein